MEWRTLYFEVLLIKDIVEEKEELGRQVGKCRDERDTEGRLSDDNLPSQPNPRVCKTWINNILR